MKFFLKKVMINQRYKGQMIKKYYMYYYICQVDSMFVLKNKQIIVHESNIDWWKVW